MQVNVKALLHARANKQHEKSIQGLNVQQGFLPC